MTRPTHLDVQTDSPRLPKAPGHIAKGSTLKDLLDREAVECLAHNFGRVHRAFDTEAFKSAAMDGLGPLGILDRGKHLARALRGLLPEQFDEAVEVLIRSLGWSWTTRLIWDWRRSFTCRTSRSSRSLDWNRSTTPGATPSRRPCAPSMS